MAESAGSPPASAQQQEQAAQQPQERDLAAVRSWVLARPMAEVR